MFNNISWIISIAQFVIFVPILFNFLLRIKDKSRQRFFILATCYLVFNFLNLSLNQWYNLNDWILNICTYLSGLFIAIAILIYIIKEFRIIDIVISSKSFIWIGIAVISASFLTAVFLIGASEIGRIALIITPSISALILVVYVHFEYRKSDESEVLNSLFLYASYLSLILITSLPLLIYLKVINTQLYSIVNITFIVLSTGYFFKLLDTGKREHELIRNIRDSRNQKSKIEDFDFTPREIETANFLLEGKSVDEIAKLLFIESSTVYKHASNIYKKTGCKGAKEFIKKFR